MKFPKRPSERLLKASRLLYDLTAEEVREVATRMRPRDRVVILWAMENDPEFADVPKAKPRPKR